MHIFTDQLGGSAIIVVCQFLQAQIYSRYIQCTSKQYQILYSTTIPYIYNYPLLKGCITVLCCNLYLQLSPSLFWCVLCKKGVSTYVMLSEILYSCMSIAENPQYYQTPKTCDIGDLVINNKYYCTYLYALRKSNHKSSQERHYHHNHTLEKLNNHVSTVQCSIDA